MFGFKLKLVKWGNNYGLLSYFLKFRFLSEDNHESIIEFSNNEGEKGNFCSKNTNSSIGETLGQSDGIIEEMETI